MFKASFVKAGLLCSLLLSAVVKPSAAVTLEQIISHENPAFNPMIARLVVGRDGLVYLAHERSLNESGYMIRMAPDGSGKTGTLIAYSNRGVAINAQGTYVVAETHFAHSATTYDKNFKRIAAFTEFENSNYDAPQHVEAGESGDFYAADLRGKRIVRFTASGVKVATYPLTTQEFRVSEKNEAFYLCDRGQIACTGFDGQARWSIPAAIGGDPWNGYTGGCDIDNNGILYVIDGRSNIVKTYDPTGKPLAEITLQTGEAAPNTLPRVSDMRLAPGSIIIHRASSTELFESYDIKTGAKKVAVPMDYEKLTVSYPNEIWTAGEPTPLSLTFTGANSKAVPDFRVWARPFGTPGYRELKIQDGQVQIPADMGGLYQIKISPETDPQIRREEIKYFVRALVEIRRPGSKGTISLWTPGNRSYYARGEGFPCFVSVRSTEADRPQQLAVRLMQNGKVIAEQKVATPTAGQNTTVNISPALIAMLRPGEYTLTASAPNLTTAPQYLNIGNGPDASPFRLTQFGDYGTDMPFSIGVMNSPDVTSFYADRSARLGLNVISERVGSQSLNWDGNSTAQMNELIARLEKDPLGAAPDKARIGSPILQSLAAWGANGVQHMPILLGNDSSTTLGTGFDPRKPEQFVKDIQTVTTAFQDYPAFRGWDWAANWWATTAGVDAADTPEQKQAYREALAKARDTGAWNPVLQEVALKWLRHAPDDTKLFNDALHEVAPNKPTAVSAPYRNVYAYPPVTFENVDEVDLHFQSEQMYPPYSYLHDVDYYKRPGKPAWGHPEVWNDSGTGEQITRELFGMVMRGADGVGFSGGVGFMARPEDSRSPNNGITSAYRATLQSLRQYGPWLTGLRNNDRVAIVASPRMLMLDEWANMWGTHFARLMEAYDSCLHAHQPASIVFVDDMKPDTLAAYKAVLLVGERIELDPKLVTALQNAKAKGAHIFYDGTCRESLVKDYEPLGISFDKMEKDPWTWGDDAAFAPSRFPAYIKANLPALRAKLDAVITPVADTDNSEVLFSERISGEGRYIFALNNTTPEIDPGQLWRLTLFVTTRVPVMAPVKIESTGKVVYDVFAGRQVTPQSGVVQADLRDISMRVYAVLPTAIAKVGLRGPQAVKAGQSFTCGVWVQDEKNAALKTAIPVRLRLIDAAGVALDERFASAYSTDGASATLTAPLDSTGNLTLEATELFSGKTTRLAVPVTASALPASLEAKALAAAKMDAKASEATTRSFAIENAFGPHIRDMSLADNGTLAVMNTFNWNENLYGVDVNTGKVRWQKRLGQAFTYEPRATSNGLAVQGFDFTSPYSYYLYLTDGNGVPSRRFALYGLSRRSPQRFLAGWTNDHMNQFATAPDGSWVAACGDLGLAVWDKSGKLLWKLDNYKTTHNTARFAGLANWQAAQLVTPVIATIGQGSLLVVDNMKATAYDASTGKAASNITLATAGETRKILQSDDGKTTAVLSTTEGGRIFILRAGKVVDTFPVVADDIALSADGNNLVAVNSTRVSAYEVGKGLRWVFNGDEFLVNPALSRDGRCAVSSKLGTLYVLSPQGAVLLHRDMGSLVVPRWLPDGDLLAGMWMGDTVRLDAKYAEKWRTHLQPKATDMRGKLLAPDATPSSEVETWTNSREKPLPLTPNLLEAGKAQVTLVLNGGKSEPITAAIDGKADAPEKPWTGWGAINWLGEGAAVNWIDLTMPQAAKVTAITLAEDGAHPESWLRDSYLEYFDEERKDWTFVMPLLANSVIHTHQLPTPITAAHWRIVLPIGVVGNVRLGEITLHGN